MVAAAAGASMGAEVERNVPNREATLAPAALHAEITRLTRSGRREPASATDRPTAKLSVELENARARANHMSCQVRREGCGREPRARAERAEPEAERETAWFVRAPKGNYQEVT